MGELPRKSDIREGIRVSIETKADQGTGRLTVGIVKKILTSEEIHPHGIKIRLEDGRVGRVKKITPKHHTVNLHEDVLVPDNVNTQITLAPNTSRPISKFVNLDEKQIPKTEDTENEFKEFYQYDKAIEHLRKLKLPRKESESKINAKKAEVQARLAQAISSLGNSNGGFVYLGIDSTGKIIGLERDLTLEGFSDYTDSFANHIRDRLGEMLKDKAFITGKVEMKFRQVDGKTLCIIQVLPAGQPVFLHETTFYVRSKIAPRAEKLTGQAQFRYIRDRFPNYV